jgi:hypothetical protein
MKATISLMAAAITMVTCLGDDDLPNPRDIPPDQRIACLNRVADRAGSANAAQHYERASKVFKNHFELAPRDYAEETDLWDRTFENEWRLAVAPQWSKTEQRLVKVWLDANRETLATVEGATKQKMCFHAFDANAMSMLEAAPPEVSMESAFLFKLAGVQANAEALAGRWDSAWDWNLRLIRMADHARQQPLLIQQWIGLRVERGACEQAMHFLARAAPEDPRRITRALEELSRNRCSDELTEFAEDLFVVDMLERYYGWAAEPEKYEDVNQMVSTMLDGAVADLLRHDEHKRPFTSADAFRQALHEHSLEQAWQHHLAQKDRYGQWLSKPPGERWKAAEDFRRAAREFNEEDPISRLLGGLIDADQSAYVTALTEAHRNALTSILAVKGYQERWGRLPRKLKTACHKSAGCDPTDPFTGESLRYRVADDGEHFTIYSVGPDQWDDGGKHKGFEKANGDFVFWPPQPYDAD